MIVIREYLNENGKSPFAKWFGGLDSIAAAKIHATIIRISQGNLSNVKSVGNGVYERKIDFGLGYRIYFAQENKKIVLLLGGGTKKRQQQDIENAKLHWHIYKFMKNKNVGAKTWH